MWTSTLTKTETKLLIDAAGRGGTLEFPEATKAAARQRLLDRFERDGLVWAHGDGHGLTPAGYRAVGLRPPRQKRAAVSPEAAGDTPGAVVASGAARRGTKLALIQDLLGRGEGASIDELMTATGWLPHTIRAALSRLRSAGKPLTKSAREDGRTAYRIFPDDPVAPKGTRSRARQPDHAEAALV
jgi:hypothetical protein